ncbi:MAG: HNH endonuclease [Candidatus Sumerlaeota bacterium]|nr:HNH endonuclease [Candidatus Sumerlaeota bacterium]
MSDTTDKIQQIRSLLDELATAATSDEHALFAHNFDALELPAIVSSIVDYLQPLLRPYESAIYWHLFRNSILATGQQFVRASTKGMRQGVITSSSGQSATLSYATVQDTLAALEDKNVIAKVGDTTRNGTLYKVNLPEEIAICQELMAQDKERGIQPVDEPRELDYYNVRENRLKVFERDGYKCHYCGKQLTRFTATLDHIQPASAGGDNSFDNLTTSCLHCNSRRGNRPVMDMYADGKDNNR